MYMAKRNIFGLIFDDRSGKVTYDDGEIPFLGCDFTFESTTDIVGQPVNPLQYATDKTGEKIIAILKATLPGDVTYKLSRIGDPAALHVTIQRNGIGETFNVGLIANSLIRQGSINSFKYELKSAGILF